MPFSVRLDQETEQELRKAASALDRPLGWMVKKALRYYLDEIPDLEITMERLKDPAAQWVNHEEARRGLGLESDSCTFRYYPTWMYKPARPLIL